MSERPLVAEVKAKARDSELFPVGLRVLAVDDDAVCLEFLTALLEKCHYRSLIIRLPRQLVANLLEIFSQSYIIFKVVTATTKAAEVLNILQQNANNFDIIIMDVDMIDEDGFTLLEIIDLEMGILIIMVSENGDKDTVTKGIMSGVCDFLIM
ncbi:hypothetical protein Nepgr_001811 [Nepenthes gracilis]|uniref:Response regulatory domain-containing protein n=1 Tax=Nepenthes gracilis TaxID=150966 RepID=A0AAD3RWB7_NEPGR|nr:hypothetical protein Nepgr_001811 [Nepenthes gracilis]